MHVNDNELSFLLVGEFGDIECDTMQIMQFRHVIFPPQRVFHFIMTSKLKNFSLSEFCEYNSHNFISM